MSVTTRQSPQHRAQNGSPINRRIPARQCGLVVETQETIAELPNVPISVPVSEFLCLGSRVENSQAGSHKTLSLYR